MKATASLVMGVIVLALLCPACGDDAQQVPPASPQEEPVDLVVDLVIEEVWTMDELAQALTEETGVEFVLAPEVDAQQSLSDPYMVMSFEQNLKEHLEELESLGLWSFTWRDGRYVISDL